MRDKYSVRCQLSEKGIEQLPFELALSNQDLKAAVDRLGLPVLIKPADGYGSQNIVLLRDPEDIDPFLSPLDDLLPCHADYGLGVYANDRLVVERYMEGAMIGCDTLTVNGEHRLLGIHEKLFFNPPSFAIRGGCFTPRCTAFEAIERYVFAVLDAVEFDWGAAHTELMLTENGMHVIEINPRLVGAKIPRLVSYALNRSLHEDVIAVHLGEPVYQSETPSLVAVTRWIVAHQPGVLEQIECPPWNDPRIRCVELLKKTREFVQPPFNNGDRLGYVMVCGEHRGEVEHLAERFIHETRVILK
jgi:biotin carboxylase